MTTSISPATGAGALFTQQGVGSTPGYAALDDRRSNSGSLQEGVYGSSTLITAGGVSNVANADFMVTQRGAGVNQSVDINMPSGGFAFVQGDTISGQGLYCVPVASATINEAIAAADATFPRVDQIILEIQDNVLDASGGNQARTRVLTGTATSGATLTNRTGATALPGNALLLADVLVPNGSSTVPNTNIRDRRKWARGALVRIVRQSADYATSSLSLGLMDGTNLTPRIECSGAPVKVTLNAIGSNGTSGVGVKTSFNIDSTAVDGSTSGLGSMFSPAAGSPDADVGYSYTCIPTAGSHQFVATFAASAGGTATVRANSTTPLVFVVEEIVRQNGQNSNGVTTG